MGTSEVDTDIRTHTATVVQVEMRFSFTCIRGFLSILTTAAAPQQSESLYTMNPLTIGKVNFFDTVPQMLALFILDYMLISNGNQ